MRTGKIFKLACLALPLLLLACTKKENGSPLNIAYPAAGAIMNTQVGLVLEKGEILRKHGFNATVSAMGTGRELKVALVSGKADVILTSESNFPVLLGEGFDAVAVNSMGSAGRLGLLVKKDQFKKMSDLKGKTIATIYGTSVHQPAMEWAQEAGGAQVVNMASVAAMQSALESGEIDAIVSWDPYLTDSLQKKRAHLLKEGSFDLIAVSSSDFAKQSTESVRRLNEALREAVFYVATHKDEINSEFAKISHIDVPVIHEASLQNKNYTSTTLEKVDLSISADFLRKLQAAGEFLAKEKVIKAIPDVASHIWK